jgi:hypothetical protein
MTVIPSINRPAVLDSAGSALFAGWLVIGAHPAGANPASMLE